MKKKRRREKEAKERHRRGNKKEPKNAKKEKKECGSYVLLVSLVYFFLGVVRGAVGAEWCCNPMCSTMGCLLSGPTTAVTSGSGPASFLFLS
jgi:hypothetical protein